MEENPPKRHSDRHNLAIAVGSAVAATVAGVVAAKGVQHFRGANDARERRREVMADPSRLLDGRIVTYRGGTIVTTVAALMGHAGPMSYESLKNVAGLTKHQVSSSLGFLASNHLVHREREDMSRAYSTILLDPAVSAAMHDNPAAYRHFIDRALQLYPEFDLTKLAPDSQVSDNS